MKNRLPLFIAAGAGLIALWYFVAFIPFQAERKSVDDRLVSAKAELHDFNSTLAQLPQIVQTRNALVQDVNEVNSKLYAKGDLLRLFADLKSKAGDFGLHVTEISPPVSELLALNKNRPDSAAPQFLNLTIGLSGEYLRLGQFVTDLEQSPYFRGVNTCSISGKPGSTGELQIFIGFKAMLGVVSEES